MTGRTAILSGSGALPRLLAARLAALGEAPVVVRFDWTGEVWDGQGEVLPARLEHLGALFRDLRQRGCTRVVLAGAMRRPVLDPAAADAVFAAAWPRLRAAIHGGDDAALRVVADLFEEQGFALRTAQEIAPEILLRKEAGGRHLPGPADLADIARAVEIVAALGRLDIGQGAVVAQGLCLGVETLPGTDALLDFVAASATGLRPDPQGARGVLYKAPKPGQDRRFDLPAIGPATLERAARAGLAGIAAEAGGAILLDEARTRALADRLGLFLWGVEAP